MKFHRKRQYLKISVAFTSLWCFVLFGGYLHSVSAQSIDTIELSQQIAASLKQLLSAKRIYKEKYSTVAFSRIQGNLNRETINELIDFTNVAIVKGRGFKVIDRSKIQLILNEQKFNLTGMVSSDTYKELGKLLLQDYVLPFEAISFLLLTAMIGALVIIKNKD